MTYSRLSWVPAAERQSDNTNGFFIIPAAVNVYESTEEPRPSISNSLFEWFRYLGGLIVYPEGKPAQALILVPQYGCCGIRG